MSGTGLGEAIAVAVMVYITARQQIEEREEQARQRAERERQRAQEKQQREAEQRARRFEQRWDVKTQRQIDAAKAEAHRRFTGETVQAVCDHLDARGVYLAEVAEGSLHGVSRGVIEDELKVWESDLAALGACDRGLLPADDRRVTRARDHVAEIVEARRDRVLSAGAGAPAPVNYVELSERAKVGADDLRSQADRAPGVPPQGGASDAIGDLMETLEARRAAPVVEQKKTVSATPSRTPHAPRAAQPKKSTSYEMEF
ncbi:hypothetical protein CAPI_01620 [Corynebacterium capitovis DSM 44611]|uniref:hypothetical protein n=1 Tax=Corynebacterium capitovis TaxID=131081 RepID=UPI00038055B8|nr:hypothetical protein [Corynebacterium capitovis]WKD56898.1 hypothetical protein CAPI_01620 [Corynebacterium capitovis DSM 44611]